MIIIKRKKSNNPLIKKYKRFVKPSIKVGSRNINDSIRSYARFTSSTTLLHELFHNLTKFI